MCPKGYDPLQSFINFPIFNITTYADSDEEVSGDFVFWFGPEYFEFSANSTEVRGRSHPPEQAGYSLGPSAAHDTP